MISLDSRQISPGDLYVALPGTKTHGANYVVQALARGARSVVTDAAGAAIIAELAGTAAEPLQALCAAHGVHVSPLPTLTVVADPRAEMAKLAADFYGHPADSLRVIGVTGTTGKTSTVALLAAGLEAAGVRAATIGTLGMSIDGRNAPLASTTVTTPESPDVQRTLAELVADGVDTVAMEVSSHALALHRVDAISFAAAAFTNLGSDHLDFHATQEDYYQAKKLLFTGGRARKAVIAVDDAAGQRLAAELRGEVDLVTVGAGGDYQVLAGESVAGKTQVRALTPSGELNFELGLPGDFSVNNALVALALLDVADVDIYQAATGFAALSVPGRMQRVELGPDAPQVVVDFAHTPEAIGNALASLPGRKIAVLGAGGDRDHGKRPAMGAAAAALADVVIVTDDNPRSEDPPEIRAQVLAGARPAATASGATVLEAIDRRQAIATALSLATPEDWVVILGKGHETTQQFADRQIAFNDVEVAQAEYRRLGGAEC